MHRENMKLIAENWVRRTDNCLLSARLTGASSASKRRMSKERLRF